MKIISFINQKGGVGKTCSTLNVGAGLSRHNKKVLLIDLDPQGSLTDSLIADTRSTNGNIYNFFTDSNQKAKDLIIKFPAGYDLIPSHISACSLEFILPGKQEFRILEDKLQSEHKNYDYILIDCPPGLGALLINAIIASTDLYLCTTPEPKSNLGLSNLQDTISKTRKNFKTTGDISGVIIGQYDARRTLTTSIVKMLKESFGKKLFKTYIRRNVDLAECVLKKQDIFQYSPGSHGAKDFESLTKEILKHG